MGRGKEEMEIVYEELGDDELRARLGGARTWLAHLRGKRRRATTSVTERGEAGGEFVVIERSEFEALLAAAEDASDLADIAGVKCRATASDYLPFDTAERILDGENPIRVWRQHRGLSASGLAIESGISKSYLSEIESGRKPGSVRVLRASRPCSRSTWTTSYPPRPEPLAALQ